MEKYSKGGKKGNEKRDVDPLGWGVYVIRRGWDERERGSISLSISVEKKNSILAAIQVQRRRTGSINKAVQNGSRPGRDAAAGRA